MLITRSQVANILEVSPATVLRWVDDGLLPEPRREGRGRYRRWEYDDILKWKADQNPHDTPPVLCVAVTPSECEPQSEDSSSKPEPS